MATQARPSRESRIRIEHEDGQRDQRQPDQVVPGVGVRHGQEVGRQRGDPERNVVPEAERVDRREPEAAVGHVEAVQRVGVADELRDDLAEAERDDRQVVAAQAERRQRR